MIDNIDSHDLLENKFFSFYLPGDIGYITFGEIPNKIVHDEKMINWAKLIDDNENPWSVRMSNIVILHKK